MPPFRALGDTAGKGYARKEIAIRGEIRQVLKQRLVKASGDPDATMCWTVSAFCEKVYLRYHLKLIGWPPEVYFTDLSRLTGMKHLLPLAEAVFDGQVQFCPITEAEYEAARLSALCAAPGPLHYGLTPKLGRDDIGRRVGSSKVDPARFPARHIRNGPKSSKWVTDEAESKAEMAERPEELFQQGRRNAGMGGRPGVLHIKQ